MLAGQTGEVTGLHGIDDGVRFEPGVGERLDGRGLTGEDLGGVLAVLLEKLDVGRVVGEPVIGRGAGEFLQGPGGVAPQGPQRHVAELPLGGRIVPLVEGATGQTLGEPGDDRADTGGRGDAGLTRALRRLEVELLEVRADHRRVGAAAEVERLVRVRWAGVLLVEQLHVAFELLGLDGLVVPDHHVERGALLEERLLVGGGQTVGVDLAHERRDPRHAAPLGDGVGDRCVVHDLLGEQEHRCRPVAGRDSLGFVDVAEDLGVEVPRRGVHVDVAGAVADAGDDGHPVGAQPTQPAVGAGADGGAVEVPTERRVELHAGEQVAGGAVHPWSVEQLEPRATGEPAGPVPVDHLLVREPDLGEREHPSDGARPDDAVLLEGLLHVLLERVADRLTLGDVARGEPHRGRRGDRRRLRPRPGQTDR